MLPDRPPMFPRGSVMQNFCSQKFYNMKLLLGWVDLPFKATNSPVPDKQSVADSLVSDIADFNLIRKCCHEA
ncbi:hypothetical protein Acr_00g0044200 [Actinidia rufa]|uniref:Uncharacterized protein n=1 Tax=Actinidia rufa TaxID=165716 RepID=A0A7J0DIW6_9ERIC|nr:hypothetical protein Acr_00g0044200 [Actinidia rufa]